jgi:Heterokaryon incompatibility protein (HET)
MSIRWVQTFHFALQPDQLKDYLAFKPFECSGASVLRHLGYSTGSLQAWAAAFSWHQECTGSHTACRPSDPSYLPTRVIDVGKHMFSNPRLTLGSQLEPGTKYATLSHCWGHSTQTRLLRSNLSSFKQKLPWKELSKTFKDVFKVTRHLGIRYLWIDSLCIIQDSPEDWARESSAMSKVYSNGYCNIA